MPFKPSNALNHGNLEVNSVSSAVKFLVLS